MARPREFEKNDVLLQSMKVFWRNGYHSTSLADLMAETGLNKQSIYSAFGDKRALFIEGLKHYAEATLRDFESGILDAKSPLKALTKIVSDISTADEKDLPKGCLVVRTTAELGSTDAEIADIIKHFNERFVELIANTLQHGQDIGEVTKNISSVHLAKHLLTVFQGIQVLKQRSAPEAEIRIIGRTTIKLIKPNT